MERVQKRKISVIMLFVVVCDSMRYREERGTMERIFKILPKYAILPIIVSLSFNMFAYFGTRPITNKLHHYDLSIPLDHQLPMIPFFMIPYLLAFATWIVGFVIICRENRQLCYMVMTAEQIAKLFCVTFFLLMPTEMARPEVVGDGLSVWLTNFVYAMDEPNNLFPSIHCLLSWLVFRGAMRCKKVGNGYRTFMFLYAILIFVTVLLTKQHLFVDILAGIAVVEIGLYVSRNFKVYRVYYLIERLYRRTWLEPRTNIADSTER